MIEEESPQKVWPLFLLAGMVALATVFGVQDAFSQKKAPTDEITPPAYDHNAEGIAPGAGDDIRERFSAVEWPFSGGSVENSSMPQLKTYSEKDIRILDAETAVTVRQYAADLKGALSMYEDPDQPSEALALMDEYENGNGGGLVTLEERARAHEVSASALLDVTTPKSLVAYHLAVTNSVSRMHYLTENMLLVRGNPLLALTSARIFGAESERFVRAMEVVNNALLARGVSAFGRGESATLYLNTTR